MSLRSSTPTSVASVGRNTAAENPTSRRGSPSGLRPGRSRQARRASRWVTMCTSIDPDCWTTDAPMPSSNSRANRVRRDVPTTSCVAFTPRAKSSSAPGTSSPITVWNVAPRFFASLRICATACGDAPASPSPRRMCSTSSSAPARTATRLARRTSVSVSGPPVTATTTRSRASHVSVICCSAR